MRTRYEEEWDAYSRQWDELARRSGAGWGHLGDEWGAAHRERYARFLRPHLPRDAVVLELGPGGGRLTELLLDDCRELIALDVSAAMLERLRARFGARPELHLLKGNGVDLAPIPDASIDAVVSYDVFVHLEHEDVYAYLVEMARVLASRGRGLIHFSNVLSPAGFAKFAAEYKSHLGGRRTPGKFSCLSVPVMRHFVESLGFQVRQVDTEHFGGGRDAFIAFEKAWD